MEFINLIINKSLDAFKTLVIGIGILWGCGFTSVEASPPYGSIFKAQGKIKYLLNRNIQLGRDPHASFEESQLQLEVGDTLLLYTDGLIENINKQDQMFGHRNLKRLIRESPGLSAKQICDRIVKEAFAFYDGVPPEDDITLIVAKIR